VRIFDDYTKHEAGGTKEETINTIVKMLNEFHTEHNIKDIFLLVRLADTDLAPNGLKQTLINGVTVDTEYEATVFMRFATDVLFDRMKQIAVKDFAKEHEEFFKAKIREYLEEEKKKEI
jgi:hypothetical protein